MKKLIEDIEACKICEPYLPLGANPIVRASKKSKIILVSQAPGSIAHKSGVPWDDPGGKRLKEWMNISDEDFYNRDQIAIVPMGFCYPGKGKGGDLPPRPECAPFWHQKVFSHFNENKLIILIGRAAQLYYLDKKSKSTLTETVKNYKDYLPAYFPIPHPSPRNRIWCKKNPWFENSIVPILQSTIKKIITR